MIKKLFPKYVILIVYFLLTASFVFFLAPRTSFVSTNIENSNSGLQLFAFTALLFLVVLYLVICTHKIELNKPILISCLALMLLLTLSLPVFSTDIGAYLVAGKNLVIHHTNPYQIPLNYYSNDPWVKYMEPAWWMNYPSVYGPVALLISSLAVLIFSSNFILAVFTYKILVLLAVLASACLFYKLDNSKSKVNILLFLLNPVLLLNILLDGHNDAFVLLSMLIFIYLIQRSQFGKSFLALFAGVFVKFSNLILLPVLFIENGKFKVWRLAFAVAAITGLFYLFLVIFRIDLNAYFGNLNNLTNNNCLYVCTPIVQLFKMLPGGWSNPARLIIFGLSYVLIFYRYLIKQTEILKFIFWVFMALFFIGSTLFAPWYAICPIVVGLLIEDKRYKYLVFSLTAYSILFYFGI